MATTTSDTDSGVPRSWILLFLLAALGLGAAAVQYVGGSLVTGAALVPL